MVYSGLKYIAPSLECTSLLCLVFVRSPGLQKEKNKLFEGLVDSSSAAGNMTFVPRSSVKKLVLVYARY